MGKKVISGNGSTFKVGSVAVGAIDKMTVPGWKKTAIDISDLSNAEVVTQLAGALKTYNNLVITVNSLAVPAEGNAEMTITFGGNVGTMTFWGDLLEVGDASFERDGKVTRDLTILLTNLNATGEETKPTLTLTGA